MPASKVKLGTGINDDIKDILQPGAWIHYAAFSKRATTLRAAGVPEVDIFPALIGELSYNIAENNKAK